MPRGRPATKKNTQAEQLQQALDFVSVATNKLDDFASYVSLHNRMAIATTGQISAGHPIQEDLELCPHLDKLKLALSKSGKTLTLTHTPSDQLSVKGDKLRVIVPCVGFNELPFNAPDETQYPADDRIKEAFKVCGMLASEAGDEVYKASVLLRGNDCTGTNGRATMLQYWHGIDLPPDMVLPKIFTQSVVKIAQKITGFGFSWSNELGRPKSFTLWFENGAWIRTQCYSDSWPDVDGLLNKPSVPAPTPEGLFDAVESVYKFNDDNLIYFLSNCVSTDKNPDVGAQYEVKGLQGGVSFNGKLLLQVSPYATSMDFTTHRDRAFFFGGTAENPVRGVLMAMGPVSDPATGRTPQASAEPTGTIGGAQMHGDDDGEDSDSPGYEHSMDAVIYNEGVADDGFGQVSNVGWGN